MLKKNKKKQQQRRVLPTAISAQIICFLGYDMLDRLLSYHWLL